jgi:ParB/RepB/Spo0J family partition protein
MNEITPIAVEAAAAAAAGPLPLPAGYHEIPIEWLWTDPQNMRQISAGEAAHQALVQNIKAQGLLQPLVVRFLPGDATAEACYLVLAGRRRLTACLEARMERVPCVVRENLTEAEELAVELGENVIRADMSAIDVWAGVERLANAGMDEATIALHLNVTLRRVKQLRAMGSLHPTIIAHVREAGDFPPESDLRIICQAPEAMQAEAFTAARKQAGKGNPLRWWQVAAGCQIQSIPLQHARFDRALYKGPIKSDLFADAETEEASSPSLFIKLQNEWLDGELARWERLGYQAARGEMEYGAMRRPKDCDAGAISPHSKKLPPKNQRAGWRYLACVAGNGEVFEQLYPVKKAPAKAGKGEGAAAQPGPASTVPETKPKANEQTQLTQKGMEAAERAQRAAVAGVLGMALNSCDLLAAAILILADKCKVGQGRALRLLEESGALDVNSDDRIQRINTVAATILHDVVQAGGVGASAVVPHGLVERIGVGFAAAPELKLDRDGLDMLKGPGRPGFNTQKELKAYMVRTGGKDGYVTFTPADLPALALRPDAPLPYGWPKPGAEPHAAEPEDAADEAAAEAEEGEGDEAGGPGED